MAAKHKAVIVGAGRIGAGYGWGDSSYTHAGAYSALKDRVELVGFVEPDEERARAAFVKWGVPTSKKISSFKDFDIVSICTPDAQHAEDFVRSLRDGVKGVWMEKPFEIAPCHDGKDTLPIPVQVNYLRRADPLHRELAEMGRPNSSDKLVVYGKDDETTRCHFRDLSSWWNASLDYRPFNGSCAYALGRVFFDNGGINPGECMKGMLGNLLDAVEGKADLWSPPYVE